MTRIKANQFHIMSVKRGLVLIFGLFTLVKFKTCTY